MKSIPKPQDSFRLFLVEVLNRGKFFKNKEEGILASQGTFRLPARFIASTNSGKYIQELKITSCKSGCKISRNEAP